MPASTSTMETAALDQANSAWLSSGAKQALPSAHLLGTAGRRLLALGAASSAGSLPAWTAAPCSYRTDTPAGSTHSLNFSMLKAGACKKPTTSAPRARTTSGTVMSQFDSWGPR